MIYLLFGDKKLNKTVDFYCFRQLETPAGFIGTFSSNKSKNQNQGEIDGFEIYIVLRRQQIWIPRRPRNKILQRNLRSGIKSRIERQKDTLQALAIAAENTRMTLEEIKIAGGGGGGRRRRNYDLEPRSGVQDHSRGR